MKNILILICVTLIFTNCRKDHTCICANPYIDVTGFKIKDTKRNAKKRCKAYETNGELNYTSDNCYLYGE
jgi:hypothetical protein